MPQRARSVDFSAIAERWKGNPIEGIAEVGKDLLAFVGAMQEDTAITSLESFLKLPQQERDRKLLAMALAPTGGTINLRRGAPGRIAAIRDMIAKENAARGPATGSLVDDFARTTLFHGGNPDLFPQQGDRFNSTYGGGAWNLGEPHGISLTADPKIYKSGQFTTLGEKKKAAIPKLVQNAKKTVDKQNAIQDKINEVLWSWKDKSAVAAEMGDMEEAQRLIAVATQLPEYVSLVAQYNKLAKTHAAQVKALKDLRTPTFARVFPLFGKPPEEALIKAWEAKGEDADLLREAYRAAYKKLAPTTERSFFTFPKEIEEAVQKGDKLYNELFLEKMSYDKISEYSDFYKKWIDPSAEEATARKAYIRGETMKMLQEGGLNEDTARQVALLVNYAQTKAAMFGSDLLDLGKKGKASFGHAQYLRDVGTETVRKVPPETLQELEMGIDRKDFGKAISNYLYSKGKKGVAYSPSRYEEYEIRMFNPQDVLFLDWRQLTDPAVRRTLKYGHEYTKVEDHLYPQRKFFSGRKGKFLTDILEAAQEERWAPSLKYIYNSIDLKKLAEEFLEGK